MGSREWIRERVGINLRRSDNVTLRDTGAGFELTFFYLGFGFTTASIFVHLKAVVGILFPLRVSEVRSKPGGRVKRIPPVAPRVDLGYGIAFFRRSSLLISRVCLGPC